MELLSLKRFQRYCLHSRLFCMTMFCLLIMNLFIYPSLHAGREASKQPLIEDFTFDCFSILRTQQKPKHFVVLNSLRGMGFFEDFLGVLGALNLYDVGFLAGVSIEYGIGGTYYDPAIGPNWWEYYFEPVHVGFQGNSPTHYSDHSIVIDNYLYDFPRMAEFGIYRKDAHRLIGKFIKLKPHIEDKVNQIVENIFGYSSIIGVHYRGTDKFSEAPVSSYDNVATYVDVTIAQLQEIGHSDIKIFIATDEQSFLDYMRVRYPSKVVCYEDSERSVNSVCVHLSGMGGTPYKKGEDALIDCLLLSRTDILLKTSSNLSLCSAYFNPDKRSNTISSISAGTNASNLLP
jgi:hypothetical protein